MRSDVEVTAQVSHHIDPLLKAIAQVFQAVGQRRRRLAYRSSYPFAIDLRSQYRPKLRPEIV